MKSTIIRLSAALACTAVIGVGAASASSHSVTNTGPHSNNQIMVTSGNHVSNTVNNQTTVNNSNFQTARSGDANVSGNTWGGNASTGNASNWNNTHTQVMNQAASLPAGAWSAPSNIAEISNTGPHSNNQIEISNHVDTTSKTTNVTSVTNNNHQSASTGNANVSGNTWGGNAWSGNANNWNNSQTNITNHTTTATPDWKQPTNSQSRSQYPPAVWQSETNHDHDNYGAQGKYNAPVYRPVYAQGPVYKPVTAVIAHCEPQHIVLPPPVRISCPPPVIVRPPVIVPPVVHCPPPVHREPPCQQHCQKPVKWVVHHPQRDCHYQRW